VLRRRADVSPRAPDRVTVVHAVCPGPDPGGATGGTPKVSIAGNLRTMSFADLMQWLSSSSKTGMLVVDGPAYTKKIYFNHGHVVAVSSDNPREMLGYYLVGWGYCSEEDLRYLIEMQDHFRAMLGELAVKLGHLDKRELDHLLLVKTEETIYDLILWEEGNFRFLENHLPERDYLSVELPVSSFLFEGFRQRDERRRIERVIPDCRHVPVLISPPEEVNDLESAILVTIDGARSIELIALECRVPEFDVLAFVHRCVVNGLMQIIPPAAAEPDRPGRSDAPWLEGIRDLEDWLDRGRLLDALKELSSLEEKHGADDEARPLLEGLRHRMAAQLDEDRLRDGRVLEPAATPGELVQLDCDPAEGFVLSRINGRYTVEQVLNQLPGSELHNRVILHNLLRRGLIKARDATSVRRYRGRDPDRPYLEIEPEHDDPFAE